MQIVEAEIGGVALAHGGVHRGLRIGAVERVGGAIDHHACGFEVGRHVGDLELQDLEVGEILAERLALEHVVARLVDGEGGGAERAGADVDAAAVEAGHGELEALALDAADEIGGGDAAVLHDDLARRLGVPAHLLLVGAETQAGRALHDDERGDAV